MAENGTSGRQTLPVTFDSVREKNLQQLKTINLAIFPIRYQDKVYLDCLHFPEFCQLAYHNDVAVGAIACRMEKTSSGGAKLYILTLGVLAPYRNMGVGSRLLARILKESEVLSELEEIVLHVQEGNDEAIAFYLKHGFAVKEVVANYYRKLMPPNAVLLSWHPVLN